MEFKHISDCWEALREAKSVEEVKTLLETFPRWSGNWEWEWSSVTGETCFIVHNWYWDKQTENEEHDWEELDQFTREYNEEEDE